MIIDQLTLHNFGIYCGRHEIDLTPEAKRPVILVGGLNGGGKTTFLDALLLVLYGKFAQCSNRRNLAYDEFLRRTINREAAQGERAAIELSFRHWQAGEEEAIKVHRSWRITGKGLKETVEVRRNGTFDSVLTDRWYEFVEELVPVQVANLFFFDGERIERFAGKQEAAKLIRTGLQSLLGLDLLNALEADLHAIERRRKRTLLSRRDRSKEEALTKQKRQLEEDRAAAQSKRAKLKNELTLLRKNRSELEDRYRRLGGDLYEKRDGIKAELERALREKYRLNDLLIELAEGIAPLALVEKLIERTYEQTEKEQQAKTDADFIELLTYRDEEILEKLADRCAESEALDVFRSFLREDRQRRAEALDVELVINAPHDLFRLETDSLREVTKRIDDILSHLSTLEAEITSLERNIAGLPDPEGLKGISAEIRANEEKLLLAEHELSKLEETIDCLNADIARKDLALEKLLNEAAKERFEEERAIRVGQVITRSKRIAAKLREQLTARHIERLELLITDSYAQLLRKQRLFEKIVIDKESYIPTIVDQAGTELSPERLSAGERQLLVVAILWGLAKACGRPIPTVIDTPLGRLDGEHREKLLDNYFPAASHQVVLLSTDQEIDQEAYQRLSPWLSKAYRIDYDDARRASEVCEGYFWKGAA